MLEIVRAASLRQLARRCASVLADAPADPFTGEWIATPTPGIGRWLALELARELGASGTGTGDGIAANITFARPGDLRRAVLEADVRSRGETEAWTPERILWTLCALRVDADPALDLPPLAPGTPLTGWARRTVELYTRYDQLRPEMLRNWAGGRDLGPDGRVLGPDDRWQARLFRALRKRLDAPSPAERLPGLCERLAADRHTAEFLEVEFPERMAFVGFTSLPGGSSFIELVQAVAATRTVRCLLLDPSPGRPPDEWTGLLRSWGAGASACRTILGPLDGHTEVVPAGTAAVSDCLLGRLQVTLATGSTPQGAGQSRADASIHIHGAQGARRQVEVLRDALLARLADDATLGEDDIVVCCSDLNRFVPHIQAVFGAPGTTAAGAAAPMLRYQVDDVDTRPDNPIVVAVRAALELAIGRFSALEVVEFCGLDAVRRRWELDDEAVSAIRRWVTELDVRWGVDAVRRSRRGVPESIQGGTWRRALDRLALGVTIPRDDVIVGDGRVPAGVEGDDVATLGHLVDIVTRLAELADTAVEVLPIGERLQLLERNLRDLVAAEPGAEWQLDALTTMCRTTTADGGSMSDWAGDVATTLDDLRPELLRRLASGGSRTNAFRGGVTVTTPQALAGIPFRIVCLLGLDDESIPGSMRTGDDLVARTPEPGDPDRRAETLDGLLASIGAAREAVLVLHDDRDLATNKQLPDGVALSELSAELDAVADATHRLGTSYRVSHPRHGTDMACFVEGAILPGRIWSFDERALAGARARSRRGDHRDAERSAAGSDGAAQTEGAAPIALADLAAFCKDPAKYLCRQVLEVRLPDSEDELESHLRTDLNGLEAHALRRTLLDRRLAGTDPASDDRFATLLEAADRLPVGLVGTTTLRDLTLQADALAAAVLERREGTVEETVPIDCALPDGRRIVGEVAARRTDDGFQVFDVGAGRMKVGDRVRAWAELLAMAASRPGESLATVLVRRDGSRGKKLVEVSALGLIRPERATPLEALCVLVDWFEALSRRPLAVSFDAFKTQVAMGEGRAWPDAGVDATLQNAWDAAVRYSRALHFLAAGRSLETLLAETADAADPGPDAIEGRVQRFLAAVDAAWESTVDPMSEVMG